MLFRAWTLSIFAVLATAVLAIPDEVLLTHDRAGRDGVNSAVQSAEGNVRKVDILTVDQVELKGSYYPGKANMPCVMLLHAIGDNSTNKEWSGFAKALQAKGYPVLAFDFRGHGDSTTVQPGTYDPKNPTKAVKGFWDVLSNQQGVKGFAANKPRPTEIKHEQFATNYYTVLANDIAAAKSFLDEQFDCNSANLVLIGAKDGATLGALWLNSEWSRFRYQPAGPGRPAMLDRQNPEGKSVVAAAWLSASATMGTSKSNNNVSAILDVAARGNKTPMIFLYGEADTKGRDVALACEKFIVGKNRKDFPNTLAHKIAGSEQQFGKNLLLESLPTTAKILDFLETAVDTKSAAKGRRANDDDFVWDYIDRSGMRQQVSARKKGATRVEFNNYAGFAR